MKPALLPVLVLMSLSVPGTAAASDSTDLLARCSEAVEQGDTEALRRASVTIIFDGNDPAIPRIAECFSRGFGEPWMYSPRMRMFQPSAVASYVPQAEKDAMERARAQEQRAAAREALAAEQLALDRKRRVAALLATRDACDALYRRDTVEALTNPVCSPLFLEKGLPD